ncbi:MAG: dihydrolipoyl dehydrogenase [Candidatus Omnitrophica bacterium]|nr:dihydrolipoyl dehydrogenase [Candidatus Omnitrophota bacterium]MCB9781648.1 dihydrolipoyl dehydrogenase [Candidatus Omnitrophota bacterium]
MAEKKTYDLIVIGAGPGGYVAAIKAAQLGMSVACIDKEKELGGTCLRVGCIPSKALLESSELYRETQSSFESHGIKTGKVGLNLEAMLERKDKVVGQLTRGVAGLFKKNGVEPYHGQAKILEAGKVEISAQGKKKETIEAKRILIATGSVSASLPGVELDGDRVGTSTEALSYPEVPKHLVVIGAGYIGLELGSVWKRLGAKVTVLEYLDRILPGMDLEISKEAYKVFRKQGLEFSLKTKVTGVSVKKTKVTIEMEGKDSIDADRVLVAVGRKPNTEGLGLEEVGVALDSRGRVEVDEDFQTNIEGIYAIGDVIRGPMLAHKAEEEGVACVEKMATGYGHVNYDAIPGVAYTHPEIASVGKTEEELKESGVSYKKGIFPFMANGRAQSLGDVEGKVKVLADADTDRILGVHIIGPRAGDLIAEAVAAIEFKASSEDMGRVVHAHPTLAEAFKEACLAAWDRPISF